MFEKWRPTKMQKRAAKKPTRERSLLWTQIFVGGAIVTVLTLLGTGIWYGTRIASLQITDVTIVGGYTIPHSQVEAKVRERLVGSYLHFVPHTFAPTYPQGMITESLLNIPRIKNAHVEVSKGQTLSIVFEEYRPFALWCTSASAPECLFLDEFGFAFAQAPELTGSAFVRYIEKDRAPKNKEQGFDPAFVKQTQVFVDLLAQELDLYVTHIEKIEDLDIEYTVSGGGVLKISQLESMEDSFDNLKSILSSEDFIHLQNGAFQYIDLRFGDKIFLNEASVDTTEEGKTASSTDA